MPCSKAPMSPNRAAWTNAFIKIVDRHEHKNADFSRMNPIFWPISERWRTIAAPLFESQNVNLVVFELIPFATTDKSKVPRGTVGGTENLAVVWFLPVATPGDHETVLA